VITDEKARTLWAGAFRPGRMHDQTAVRTEGIADLFTRHPQVRAKVDAGYRGLARQFPDQVRAPPLTPNKTPSRKKPPPARNSATSSHQNGSASSMPTPGTSNGASSSGSPDPATTSRPTWPSPAWSPTAPPSANHQPARQASTPQR
jgi:hypothetical protein